MASKQQIATALGGVASQPPSSLSCSERSGEVVVVSATEGLTEKRISSSTTPSSSSTSLSSSFDQLGFEHFRESFTTLTLNSIFHEEGREGEEGKEGKEDIMVTEDEGKKMMEMAKRGGEIPWSFSYFTLFGEDGYGGSNRCVNTEMRNNSQNLDDEEEAIEKGEVLDLSLLRASPSCSPSQPSSVTRYGGGSEVESLTPIRGESEMMNGDMMISSLSTRQCYEETKEENLLIVAKKEEMKEEKDEDEEQIIIKSNCELYGGNPSVTPVSKMKDRLMMSCRRNNERKEEEQHHHHHSFSTQFRTSDLSSPPLQSSSPRSLNFVTALQRSQHTEIDEEGEEVDGRNNGEEEEGSTTTSEGNSRTVSEQHEETRSSILEVDLMLEDEEREVEVGREQQQQQRLRRVVEKEDITENSVEMKRGQFKDDQHMHPSMLLSFVSSSLSLSPSSSPSSITTTLLTPPSTTTNVSTSSSPITPPLTASPHSFNAGGLFFPSSLSSPPYCLPSSSAPTSLPPSSSSSLAVYQSKSSTTSSGGPSSSSGCLVSCSSSTPEYNEAMKTLAVLVGSGGSEAEGGGGGWKPMMMGKRRHINNNITSSSLDLLSTTNSSSSSTMTVMTEIDKSKISKNNQLSTFPFPQVSRVSTFCVAPPSAASNGELTTPACLNSSPSSAFLINPSDSFASQYSPVPQSFFGPNFLAHHHNLGIEEGSGGIVTPPGLVSASFLLATSSSCSQSFREEDPVVSSSSSSLFFDDPPLLFVPWNDTTSAAAASQSFVDEIRTSCGNDDDLGEVPGNLLRGKVEDDEVVVYGKTIIKADIIEKYLVNEKQEENMNSSRRHSSNDEEGNDDYNNNTEGEDGWANAADAVALISRHEKNMKKDKAEAKGIDEIKSSLFSSKVEELSSLQDVPSTTVTLPAGDTKSMVAALCEQLNRLFPNVKVSTAGLCSSLCGTSNPSSSSSSSSVSMTSKTAAAAAAAMTTKISEVSMASSSYRSEWTSSFTSVFSSGSSFPPLRKSKVLEESLTPSAAAAVTPPTCLESSIGLEMRNNNKEEISHDTSSFWKELEESSVMSDYRNNPDNNSSAHLSPSPPSTQQSRKNDDDDEEITNQAYRLLPSLCTPLSLVASQPFSPSEKAVGNERQTIHLSTSTSSYSISTSVSATSVSAPTFSSSSSSSLSEVDRHSAACCPSVSSLSSSSSSPAAFPFPVCVDLEVQNTEGSSLLHNNNNKSKSSNSSSILRETTSSSYHHSPSSPLSSLTQTPQLKENDNEILSISSSSAPNSIIVEDEDQQTPPPPGWIELFGNYSLSSDARSSSTTTNAMMMADDVCCIHPSALSSPASSHPLSLNLPLDQRKLKHSFFPIYRSLDHSLGLSSSFSSGVVPSLSPQPPHPPILNPCSVSSLLSLTCSSSSTPTNSMTTSSAAASGSSSSLMCSSSSSNSSNGMTLATSLSSTCTSGGDEGKDYNKFIPSSSFDEMSLPSSSILEGRAVTPLTPMSQTPLRSFSTSPPKSTPPNFNTAPMSKKKPQTKKKKEKVQQQPHFSAANVMGTSTSTITSTIPATIDFFTSTTSLSVTTTTTSTREPTPNRIRDISSTCCTAADEQQQQYPGIMSAAVSSLVPPTITSPSSETSFGFLSSISSSSSSLGVSSSSALSPAAPPYHPFSSYDSTAYSSSIRPFLLDGAPATAVGRELTALTTLSCSSTINGSEEGSTSGYDFFGGLSSTSSYSSTTRGTGDNTVNNNINNADIFSTTINPYSSAPRELLLFSAPPPPYSTPPPSSSVSGSSLVGCTMMGSLVGSGSRGLGSGSRGVMGGLSPIGVGGFGMSDQQLFLDELMLHTLKVSGVIDTGSPTHSIFNNNNSSTPTHMTFSGSRPTFPTSTATATSVSLPLNMNHIIPPPQSPLVLDHSSSSLSSALTPHGRDDLRGGRGAAATTTTSNALASFEGISCLLPSCLTVGHHRSMTPRSRETTTDASHYQNHQNDMLDGRKAHIPSHSSSTNLPVSIPPPPPPSLSSAQSQHQQRMITSAAATTTTTNVEEEPEEEDDTTHHPLPFSSVNRFSFPNSIPFQRRSSASALLAAVSRLRPPPPYHLMNEDDENSCGASSASTIPQTLSNISSSSSTQKQLLLGMSPSSLHPFSSSPSCKNEFLLPVFRPQQQMPTSPPPPQPPPPSSPSSSFSPAPLLHPSSLTSPPSFGPPPVPSPPSYASPYSYHPPSTPSPSRFPPSYVGPPPVMNYATHTHPASFPSPPPTPSSSSSPPRHSAVHHTTPSPPFGEEKDFEDIPEEEVFQDLVPVKLPEVDNAHPDYVRIPLHLDKLPRPNSGKMTIMLRNIPNKYDQKQLMNELNLEFKGLYDFFYLPIDFRNKCNVGYAFVNFIHPYYADLFRNRFEGVKLTQFRSTKICQVSWGRVQGLRANIQYYRHSAVLAVPDSQCKPVLLKNGVSLPWPDRFEWDSPPASPSSSSNPAGTIGAAAVSSRSLNIDEGSAICLSDIINSSSSSRVENNSISSLGGEEKMSFIVSSDSGGGVGSVGGSIYRKNVNGGVSCGGHIAPPPPPPPVNPKRKKGKSGVTIEGLKKDQKRFFEKYEKSLDQLIDFAQCHHHNHAVSGYPPFYPHHPNHPPPPSHPVVPPSGAASAAGGAAGHPPLPPPPHPPHFHNHPPPPHLPSPILHSPNIPSSSLYGGSNTFSVAPPSLGGHPTTSCLPHPPPGPIRPPPSAPVGPPPPSTSLPPQHQHMLGANIIPVPPYPPHYVLHDNTNQSLSSHHVNGGGGGNVNVVVGGNRVSSVNQNDW